MESSSEFCVVNVLVMTHFLTINLLPNKAVASVELHHSERRTI